MPSKLLLENGLDFSYLLNERLSQSVTVPQPLLGQSELSQPGTPGTPGTPGIPGVTPPLPSVPIDSPVDSARRPPPRSRDRVSSTVSRRL